jgi:hypothetical protein
MAPNFLFVLIFLHLYSCLYAADNLRTGDIRSVGMGGNEATTSALFNPSLIALSERHIIRINYFNRYGLKELGNVNGSLYLPNDMLPLGVDIASFGYDAYRESMFRFLAAKRLNSRWAFGVSVQYALLQTELYEEQPAQLSVDMGLAYAPVDNLLASLSITNFPSIFFGDEFLEKKEFMYCLIQAGFLWEVMNRVFISAALTTSKTCALGGCLGIEYAPFGDFSIRAGVKGAPLLPSFGFGYGFSGFNVDVAAVYHAVLGISTGVGLSFSF